MNKDKKNWEFKVPLVPLSVPEDTFIVEKGIQQPQYKITVQTKHISIEHK